MRYQIRFALVVLAACSQTAVEDQVVNVTPDASQLPRFDAGPQQPPPQYPDAGVMPPPKDAMMPMGDACAPQVTQLLKNPSFDQPPQGTGWTQTLIISDSPLITDEDGVVEHTAPYKAWLGGFEALLFTTVTDSLVQNVTIPANTTALTLTGMYDVRTSEPASTTEYDTAKLTITETDGTVIATVLALSNKTPKTAWTMFGHAFTQNLSGKTVRFHITSTNDSLDVTSFFFDSLGLTATHGCAAPIN
jgi:hypothetical protein